MNIQKIMSFLIMTGFILTILILIAGCAKDTKPADVSEKRYHLKNGMEIILKPNHASPMITSMIFVKAGSKYEDRYNNGLTHFLEHLLFNGTATRTQEEIEKGVERLGGYINAFTRKDFTAYLVLMPREYIEYGMATQADMLFNSVIPEERLPKERGIVCEEIKMGNDAEGAPAEAFFEESAYAQTPYARPIIGYETIISNIPREAIIDYYKRFYAPDRMMTLIIGDFEIAEMEKTVERVFGGFTADERPPLPEIVYEPIKGIKLHEVSAPVQSTYINLSLEAPRFSDSGWFACNLIADYLGDEEISPLIRALKGGEQTLATDVNVELDTREEFSRINIGIIANGSESIGSIITACNDVFANLIRNLPPEGIINGYKISRRCNDIYLSEKLHYYGFMIAPLLAITGWDFFEKIGENIESVSISDIEWALQRYLTKPSYVATAVRPEASPGVKSFRPLGPTVDEVTAYYQKTEFPEYDLSAGGDFRMPDMSKITDKPQKQSVTYLKETLDNGLEIIIKSNPDSRVFAMNVIGKNRAATEPDGLDGLTDMVNHLIEKGTIARPAGILSAELAAIGANVTLYDNPWISHDDRYTTPEYSFMKFETIDEFADRGMELFADMILHPAFDQSDFEAVRRATFGQIGRRGGSTYQVARKLFYETLFAGKAYAKTIEGTYRTLNAITLENIRAHHKKMYSPENMILTVCTNHDPVRIMESLKGVFGGMEATGFEPIEAGAPVPIKGVRTAHEKMDKEQVYIYMGHVLPSVTSPEAPAIRVAAAVLSIRLKDELREKQGLAYSVGASANLDKNFGWLVCAMGTGAANFEKAKAGILAEIERLKNHPPDHEELVTAVNDIWGSYLSANLSRINQAYYMGVYEYLGLGYNYGDKFISEIRKVTTKQVQDAAQKYFDTSNYVLATAGNI